MSSQNADGIDAAYKDLKNLLPDLQRWVTTISNEQDTRLKMIDPIFIRVLGWDPSAIATEEYTGEGFVDYKFSIDDRARMVVEAKQDGTDLGIAKRTPGKPYKLDGPVLRQKPLPLDGIIQAIRYCGAKNAELACVTNGREWIIFRGSRLGDGRDTLNGMAFIFPTLESVEKNFTLFFDLIGRSRVEKYIFRAYFQEAEGQIIRAKSFSRTLWAINGYRLIERSPLSQDIDRVMTTFFRRISGDDDPEMLAKCFVTTKESQLADERLIRITDELATRVRDLDTNEATALTQVIKRIHETQRNEFVLLVGTKGAGKSTFMDRFFRYVLPKEVQDVCIVARLDVGNSHGDTETVVQWLDRCLLDELEQTLFGEGGPTYEELQGMYFDEYTRWIRGPHKFLYETNKTEFKEIFGTHIDNRREQHPEDYIRRMIRHIVFSRRKVPCLVFDNTDHFSIRFQEKVFQYARSIYESEMCLVLIPITDKTSWQLSQQGALQSFDNEAFFLPTPQPRIVVERRISFLEDILKNERREKGKGYFFGKGIQLSLDDLQGFVTCLQHVFLETGSVSSWIGNLANNDIRRCLHLSREIVASPYLRVVDLLKAFIAKSGYQISEFDIKRAIIRKGYNIYPTGQNEFVQNVFALNTEVESTPLLCLRILRLLRDAKHHEAGGLEDYVIIEQTLDYLQALNIDRRATLLCLDAMLKTGLCYSYDPTIQDIHKVDKIQISTSGHQHLLWGSWDDTYIGSMLKVTPIVNETVYNSIHSLETQDKDIRWRLELIIFMQYLLDEDNTFIIDIDHPAYLGQLKLKQAIKKKIRKLQTDKEEKSNI
ncbi:MAG: hypothetical protein JW749_04930 [Sedimentisphaerales bacterium]|nr:hypothetical protein [Sedimentisphaerales bacterium]